MNVEEIVKNRFASIVGVPVVEVDLAADLRNDYGIDSVKALKLISEVEVEFDVDFEQEEARRIETLNDLLALLGAKLAPSEVPADGRR